jgi:hypothetical protein
MRITDLLPGDAARIDEIARLLVESFADLSPGWVPTAEAARDVIGDGFGGDKLSRVLLTDGDQVGGWIALRVSRLASLGAVAYAHRAERQYAGQTNMTEVELLKRVERCFDQGEIETLVNFVPGAGAALDPASAWVKVIHRPSGLEAVGDKSPSQTRNKAAAILEILRLLHESAAATR